MCKRVFCLSTILSVLVSCGSVETINQRTYINPDLKPYYKAFIRDYKLKSSKIDIDFGFLPQDVAGNCRVSFRGKEFKRKITVDKAHWLSYNSYQKKWLMYHELGHCLLFRGHESDFLENHPECPKSIMLSYVDARCFKRFHKFYLNELINPNYPEPE